MQSPQTNGKQNGMSMQHLEPAEVLSVLKAAKAKEAKAGNRPIDDPAEPEHDPSTEGAVPS